MEGTDITELLTLLAGAGAAIVALGAFISRFTKTDKDDKFFARLKGVFKKQR